MSIPRGELAKIIYQKVKGRCETLFGESIRKIEDYASGVRVSFKRTDARHFDLVVGADGLHSAVRKLVFGKHDLFEKYLGTWWQRLP